MRSRFLASIGSLGIAIVVTWLASTPIAGQGSGSQKKWTPPRTSWGDPDIQGQWNSQTSTPLERPQSGELAKKDALTDEEAESLEEANRRTFDQQPAPGDTGTYNAFWRDEGKALKRT